MSRDLRRPVLAFTSVAAAFAFFAAASIFTLDGPAWRWAAATPHDASVWVKGTQLLDLFFQKQISDLLLGPVLLLAGGVLFLLQSTRRTAWLLVYVGAVQFTSTLVASLLRPLIGRLPPGEGIAGMDTWLAGGASFPSSHTAFYAGLFFPLMLISPRWSFLFAIPPLFVAAADVLQTGHYLSDVSAALALAALATGGLAFIRAKAEDYW